MTTDDQSIRPDHLSSKLEGPERRERLSAESIINADLIIYLQKSYGVSTEWLNPFFILTLLFVFKKWKSVNTTQPSSILNWLFLFKKTMVTWRTRLQKHVNTKSLNHVLILTSLSIRHTWTELLNLYLILKLIIYLQRKLSGWILNNCQILVWYWHDYLSSQRFN